MSLSLSTCVKKLGQTTLPRIAPVALRTGFNASLNLNRLYSTETEKPADPAPEKPAEKTSTPPPQEPPKTEQKRSYYEEYGAPQQNNKLRLAVCAGTLAALGGYYFYQDYKKKPKLVKIPSAEDALNKFISKDEASLFVKGKVFNRVDVDTVAHNNPMEDGFLAAEVEGGYLFGVADGHGGSQCSKNVAKFLPVYFKNALKAETERANNLWVWQKPSRKQIVANAFKRAFLELDEDLVNLAFNTISNIKKPESLKLSEQQKVLDLIPSSLTGCSATVAFIENDDVYVASTGSSQAFLSKEQKNNWEVINLIAKHEVKNPYEATLLRAAHPKEDILAGGKILGIYKDTRAFGDSLLKWNKTQRNQIEKYLSTMDKKFLEPIDKQIVTPPYITAMPDVRALKINSNDRFLVISSEEVVKQMSESKIASCIAEYKQSKGKKNAATHVMKKAFNKKVEEDMALMVIFFNGNEEGKSTLKFN
ncbi:protein serine/threonine phosphatase 2C [Neocallimastix lanati (nom. inval.)]|jgi:serine/threonine protein phosphatase PrpC|uniref:Protein serine/threonine phosphatase 2C n=1 Tax=Neocallimastix californiae TaxID=1754190 RepID=A0A1Y2AG35_9FUNG|nr:protein serine/threonine phosphatase 2C [Neocallimastix sp. JGI-2020a]ORY21404.1 protein serine/threonine phosphatase 2C [Neocallimastix californiae]|eukprot:ORY21404.1 protein serine/threonine phosphatase 2C [Neocallimastix californiae]